MYGEYGFWNHKWPYGFQFKFKRVFNRINVPILGVSIWRFPWKDSLDKQIFFSLYLWNYKLTFQFTAAANPPEQKYLKN